MVQISVVKAGKENEWIKMITYVDDAFYFASEDKVREHFELTLKNKLYSSSYDL